MFIDKSGFTDKIGVFFVLVLVLAMILTVIQVNADTRQTTITFKVPVSVAHSIAYRTPCSATVFYFIENDSTIDGTQTAINVCDAAGTTFCYDSSQDNGAPMNLTNDGNVNVNVSADTNWTVANVVLKVGQNRTGYRADANCLQEPPTTNCTIINSTRTQKIITNLPATGSDKQALWWWADFSSFGAGSSITNTSNMTTNATQA